MGRDWQSPRGNLYASTLVRLRATDPQPATLALVAAVALHETAAAFAPEIDLSIKWPNDLMSSGAKLAGVLLERAGDAIVVGIGVNLAFRPDGLARAVTSLSELGVDIDPSDFCIELAGRFAAWRDRWRQEGLEVVRAAWLRSAHPSGTPLTVNLGDGRSIDGGFDGLDHDGALCLRLADGSVRVIHAGDVFLI